MRILSKLVKMDEGVLERSLCDFLGIFVVAGNPVCQPEDSPLMSRYKLFKCSHVSVFGCGHKLRVGIRCCPARRTGYARWRVNFYFDWHPAISCC